MKSKLSLNWTAISPYGLLLAWALPIVLGQLCIQQSLMAHDEGYYALQARYILETGDWITPQWGGGASFDRTMGIQWLIAVCYKLFGVNETSVRLPSLVAYLVSTGLTFRIGELTLGRTIGFLGALIWAVMPIGVQYAGLGTQDMTLVMLELFAAWSLLEAQISGRRSLLLLTGVMFGWGFMIKGFMIIPAAIAFLPALWLSGIYRGRIHPGSPLPEKKSSRAISFRALGWLTLGGAIGLMPVVGWLWAATQQYGWEPLQTLVGKVLWLNDQAFHTAGPFYYFWNIPANAFPWGVIAPMGLALCCLNPKYQKTILPYRWLILGFPILLFIELNLFKTKTPYYPIQLLPWLALWSAVLLNHCTEYYQKDWRSQLLGQISGGLGILGLILLTAGILGLSGAVRLEGEVILAITALLAILGIAWLMPWLVWQKRSFFSTSRLIDRWLWSILLGPWLALTFMGLTGLWGDYAVSLKAGLRTPAIRQHLANQTLHFVSPLTGLESDAQKDYILLTFHTPHLGKHVTSIEQLPPKSYAWIAPSVTSDDRPLGDVRGWRLIQHDRK